MSCTPVLAPRAPKGDTWCAASPAKITRPWRNGRCAAGELVDRHPLQLELGVRAQHGRMRGMTRSGFFSSSGSASQPSWKSMRQTLSACLCSSTDWPRMEGRVEPEPALGGEIGLHHHVGDQEAVLEELAGELGAHHAAGVTVGAVAGDHPVGLHLEHAVGRLDGQGRTAWSSLLLHRRPACASSAGRRAACAAGSTMPAPGSTAAG
jgi:hypothetical protein